MTIMPERRARALNESWRLRGSLTWHDLDHWVQTHYRSTGAEEAGNDRVGIRQLADITGYHWNYLQAVKRRGVISPMAADRIAGRLHQHPSEIWPNWYEVA